jgi:hypothetical protein
MSGITPPTALTDDETCDQEWLYDNYNSEVTHSEWQRALDWAHKGDFQPIVECLRRTDMVLNNENVREWLANGLERGFKKPNKVAKRPTLKPFELDGVHYHVDERYLEKLTAIRRVRELQGQGNSVFDAVAIAAKEYGIREQTLNDDQRRGWKHWGITDPEIIKRMFGGILGK